MTLNICNIMVIENIFSVVNFGEMQENIISDNEMFM